MFHFTCKGKQILCYSCDKNEINVPTTPDELNVPYPKYLHIYTKINDSN